MFRIPVLHSVLRGVDHLTRLLSFLARSVPPFQLFLPYTLLVVVLASGCGEKNELGRKLIRGRVTLDGESLDFGSIQFAPQQAGVASGAEIRQGEYEIPVSQGLTPGSYVVRVYAADGQAEAVEPTLPGPGIKVQPERVPARYNRKSELELVVAEDDPSVEYNLELESP